MRILPMQNTVQEYPWGSPLLMEELTGKENPGRKPQAELWMGAHPRGPSRVPGQDGWIPLDKLIAEDPAGWLGNAAAEKFGQLPFLFKILTAGKPLSIQAHPSREQAEAGFADENRRGIDLGAFSRSYRDRNHKPEVLRALTPFSSLCGFREPSVIARLFTESGTAGVLGEAYRNPEEHGLDEFFRRLMEIPADLAAGAAETAAEGDPWCRHLQEFYPGDRGVLAPLYLNTLEMNPGQAVYIPAGVLHSYIRGAGVELMANSDNVLRGGLTGKHIDIPELMRVLQFEPHTPCVMGKDGASAASYTPPVEEFSLEWLPPGEAEQRTLPKRSGPSLVLVLEKELQLTAPGESSLLLGRGDSAFIPPETGPVRITGAGGLFQAAVPE